jgi:cobyrinic acid a,c-diamide synthase
MTMRRLLISAAHKSSGKTILSIGISAALTARGLSVQSFKKGPDYIDPMWLAQATHRSCYNLDPYLSTWDHIHQLFESRSTGCDVQLVEANKGLFDGITLDGSDSNAALAKQLDLPVVLVIDARGMTRGIAPLLLGYQAFDPSLNICGVILNRVGGARHETKLRTVIEHYTSLSVLGAVADHPDLNIDERHLGLIPSNEADAAMQRIAHIASVVEQSVDLDRMLQVAKQASYPTRATPPVTRTDRPLRIAVAKDSAFGFYYADDLEAMQAQGAQLVAFNTLEDAQLPPDIDGLFIGGGFPEMLMPQLQANVSLRQQIAQAIRQGLPTYAECGGLMYLSKSISWKNQNYEMVGAIEGDIVMTPKPVGRGYVHLKATTDMPWPGFENTALRAHEFHYSKLINLASQTRFAWQVQRGCGIDQQRDGLMVHNLLASYTHLRNTGLQQWTQSFLAFVQKIKSTGGFRRENALKVAA